MIKISLKYEEELRNIKAAVRKKSYDEFEGTVNQVAEELAADTPVLTGLAASSWETVKTQKTATVTNSQEYVKMLNAGSSKQAPAFFIESVLLRHGKPKGSLVEYK